MQISESVLPRYKRLAQKLWEEIVHAGLSEGSRIPSVRTLAVQHEVSLTTAMQALRWLETQRHIEARPRSGYFVARPLGHASRARATEWPNPPAELDAQARDHLAMVGAPCAVRLDLAVGEPSLYPVDRLSVLLRRRAYQQPDLVGAHARGAGHPDLLREIARQAMQYRCELAPDELVVTNGCIEALNLALRAVTRPGDVVAVESPTYFVLLQMLGALALRVLPIPCRSGNGMDLDALRNALNETRIDAVVTIANANNPVGSIASDADKAALVKLLQARNIPLIEDDIFGDVCYDELRPRPARAFDTSGNVLLCGGFSKSLCPGLRLGWVAAGKFSDKVRALKYTTSMATAELQQTAVAGMLSSGGFALHLRRLKGALQDQQSALRNAVLRHFPEGTEMSDPRGGFVLWLKLPATGHLRVSTRAMFERARAEGIGFAPGHLFGHGGAYDDCLRLNAGYRWTSNLDKAVERLGALARNAVAVSQ